jgi:hypothetical protein
MSNIYPGDIVTTETNIISLVTIEINTNIVLSTSISNTTVELYNTDKVYLNTDEFIVIEPIYNI